ncbi:MAG: hypothetical protein ACRCZ9_08080 [Fusobacteriaceae bacterium]
MSKDIVLITYPGTFQYGDNEVRQPLESFVGVHEKILGLPVQLGHSETGIVVGTVTRVISSPNNYIYGEISYNESAPPVFAGVSLGYMSNSKQIGINQYELVGAIMPYHVALTDTPRKEQCLFGNTPSNQQLSSLFDSKNFMDFTDLADITSAVLVSFQYLSTTTGMTMEDLINYASNGQPLSDVFYGELASLLELPEDSLPEDILNAAIIASGTTTSDTKYVPGSLLKSLKDSKKAPKTVPVVAGKSKMFTQKILLK